MSFAKKNQTKKINDGWFEKFNKTSKIDKLPIIRAIRGGLVMIIPLLMVGSFALILKSFPVSAYLSFIKTFASGLFYKLFDFIYNATFGLLSIYMAMAVGYTISKETAIKTKDYYGAPLSSLVSFFIFSGVGTENFEIAAFGPQGMFTAIVCATSAAWLYLFLSKRLEKRIIYSDGADLNFNRAISIIFPLAIVALCYGTIELLLVLVCSANSFFSFISMLFEKAFLSIGNDFLGGFLYVFLSSIMWFFGIHGSDMLESVNQNVFIPATEANIEAFASGLAPTKIFTKTFFDVFVLMGGCGTLLCLLIAILLFSKRKSNRTLAKIATFPMIFNINELMVFGLPIIYNPIMLIPFLLAPISSFMISSVALYTGIVPYTIASVEWTTPIFLGGYQATGSVMGIVLQAVNLIVGVLIYMPFVKLYDAKKEKEGRENIEALTDVLKQCETSHTSIKLTEIKGEEGDVAKQLVNDLRAAIDKDELYLVYQPQYDSNNKLIGAETLLRWCHPLFGMIYPPLIIKIADESNLLSELERYIFTRMVKDTRNKNLNLRISINSTAKSLQDEEFKNFVIKTLSESKTNGNESISYCVEITEQSELITNTSMMRRLKELKASGLMLAIDDFSMGFTSLKYLQESEFDLVKLDGSLVKKLMTDTHTADIISSIVYLSHSMNFSVLAEFVETKEQKEKLQELGCTEYQGYYFKKAISIEELVELCNIN